GHQPRHCHTDTHSFRSTRAQFTEWCWKKPEGRRFLQALNGRFLPWAPIAPVSPQASCAAGAPFRMKKELDGLYWWRKDPTSENEPLTKAVELEPQAVLGRLARTAQCRCMLASTERNLSLWKDALVVIFQRKRLSSLQEELRWKSSPHGGVAWMSLSALSWRV